MNVSATTVSCTGSSTDSCCDARAKHPFAESRRGSGHPARTLFEGGSSRVTTNTEAPHWELAQAYEAFAPVVRRALMSFGIARPDVPDLCHEVFVVMHEKSPAGQICNVGGWLKAIARRLASGHRRKSERRRKMLLEHPADVAVTSSTTSSWINVEERDQEETLRAALDSLDNEARELLALHDVGDMTLTHLAERLGRDRKTVRKRLAAARRDVALFLAKDQRPARQATSSFQGLRDDHFCSPTRVARGT